MHQAGNVKQELKHEPVSTRVKLKILPHLLRSRLAAECFPANIQVGSLSILLGTDGYSQFSLLSFADTCYSKSGGRQEHF